MEPNLAVKNDLETLIECRQHLTAEQREFIHTLAGQARWAVLMANKQQFQPQPPKPEQKEWKFI